VVTLGEKNHVPLSINHFNVVSIREMKMGDTVMDKTEINQLGWLLLKTGAKAHCLGSKKGLELNNSLCS
jgi:hypothetical protein